MSAYAFLTQPNQYNALQTMAVGQRAKENRLADMSRQYAGAAMGGDQNALAKLGGVNPELALNVKQEERLGKQFTQQEKLQRLDEIASVYNQAQTPQDFQKAVQYFQQKGYNLDPAEMDFNNRQNVVAQAMSLKEQIAQAQDARDFKADEDYRAASLDIQRQGLDQRGQSGVLADVEARKGAAAEMGLTPDSPAYQSFVLTGKMPREDAQPLTSTDKKAILEADDMAFASENAIGQLKQALKLNDSASYGSTADAESFAARNDPWGILNATGVINADRGAATTEFKNIVLNNALGSMKSIFGGNPTEGERAILVELQASVDKTPAERKPILERAIKLAERRLQFNRDRATEIRGQEFYKPGGGASGGGGQTTPIKTKGGDMSPENIQTLIEQANAAVQAGADPAKVRQRLIEQGVELEE